MNQCSFNACQWLSSVWQSVRYFVLDEPSSGGVAKDLVKFAILRLSLHFDDFEINIRAIGLTGATLTSVASVLHSTQPIARGIASAVL